MRWHPLSGRPWKEYNGEKTSRSTVDRREQQYAATVSIRCVAWSHSSCAATSRSGPSIFSPRAATPPSHLGPEVHCHHPCPELGRSSPSPLYMGDPSFQPRMLTGGTAANGRGPWPSTEAATTASSSTSTPTPSTAAARIRQIRGNEVTTHLTFKGTTPSSRGKCQDEETPLLLDMILAADSSASDLIRSIATECGVEFDEDLETMVIDHINYASTEVEGDHTLIAGDDLIQSDVILGSKKIELEIRLVKMSSTQDMLGLLCDQRERR